MLGFLGAIFGAVIGAAGSILVELVRQGRVLNGPKPGRIWRVLLGVCLALLIGCIVSIVFLSSRDGETDGPIDLAIEIVSINSPVPAGSDATVTAETSPGAACTIEVVCPSGESSEAAGLRGVKTADDHGHVEWEWHVSGNTKAGIGSVTVKAQLNGESAEDQVALEVK